MLICLKILCSTQQVSQKINRGLMETKQEKEQQLKDSLGCVSTEQLTDPSCPERLVLCFDEFGQRAVEDTSHSPIETIFIQDKRRLAAGGTPSPRVQVYFLTTITRDPSAPGSRHGTLPKELPPLDETDFDSLPPPGGGDSDDDMAEEEGWHCEPKYHRPSPKG